MKPLIFLKALLFALSLGLLSGCEDEHVYVSTRRLDMPLNGVDDTHGGPVYLGHPGEQRLHWVNWRHRWIADFSGPKSRFVSLPGEHQPLSSPSGPGVMGPEREVHPAWEKACHSDAAAGHLMCHAVRQSLLVGIIEQRVGRVCLAFSDNGGDSFHFSDLGSNDYLTQHGTHETHTKLARCEVAIAPNGIAAVVLAWETEILAHKSKPGTDFTKIPDEAKDGWKIECITLTQGQLLRYVLPTWPRQEFIFSLRISHAHGLFWVAASGREVWAWSLSEQGDVGQLITLPDSRHSSTAEILPMPKGAFVAWRDSRKTHRVGIPGPWELPRSKHTQIAICEIREGKAGATRLISPSTHCALSLAAGLTAEGPSLCWIVQRIYPGDVTMLDSGDLPQIHELTLAK